MDEKPFIRKKVLRDEDYLKRSDAFAKVGLWILALFELACSAPLRRGEILNIRRHQVDLLGRQIRLVLRRPRTQTRVPFT
jgi:hypothetical protein